MTDAQGAQSTKKPEAKPAPKTVKAEATKITPVKFGDETVEFPGKRKLVKVSDPKTLTTKLYFVNGQKRVFVQRPDMVADFACHGAEQKLGDETAGLDDIDDAVEAVDTLIERLNAGEWTQRREGSGLAGTSVLIRAIVEAKGRTVEQVREFLKDKTQAEKMALRMSKMLKPIVDRIEAEKAAKSAKVDTDAMLGELDGIPSA